MSAETLAHNGLPGPQPGTPARRPRSVRRTTSLDLTLPDGPDGPLAVGGRARDLATDHSGTPTVLASALTSLTVTDGVVTALSTYPRRPALTAMVGRQALVGWRTGLWRTIRDDVEHGSDLHQLLDDLPGGYVISGFTRGRARAAQAASDPLPSPGRRLDVCAGWAADSRAARILETTGGAPRAVTPKAVPIDHADDPRGWHTWPTLPPWGISRRRRVDAWRDDATGQVQLDAHFRDSFVDDAGHERVLHEYALAGHLGDAPAYPVVALAVTPHVLPHTECPRAAASVQEVVGMPCADLRDRVSATLFGPGSCTHLNDVVRFIADVPALVQAAETAWAGYPDQL